VNEFTILPAIDLQGGKCVRLQQGKADKATVYGDNPVAQAKSWEDQGASYLHVVDLDGAFEGRPMHTEVIKEICEALSIPVELGGGLRTESHVAEILDAGVQRAILGTKALETEGFTKGLIKEFGERIAIGIDAKNSLVQISGWVDTTKINAYEFGKQVSDMGAATIIYTDTSRDGMLSGVNGEAMATMCDAVSCDVIASGGVTSLDDVPTLKKLGRKNLTGVIVGKALYDGRVTLAELNQEAKA